MNIDNIIKKVDKRIGSLLSERHASVDGGKMLRARLFLSFAGKETKSTIDIASSIELVHAATLIHDDVLDSARLRRGKAPLFRQRGVSESILYGDHLFAMAFSVLSGLMDPLINKEMTSALSETLEGEMREKKNAGKIDLDTKEYFSIIRKKTGVLLGVSAKLGSLQRGDNTVSPGKAYSFGQIIGTVYQMLDDLLDLFDVTNGKDVFTDIRAGVGTLPFIYLKQRSSEGETAFIESVFGRDDVRLKEIEKIMSLMKKYHVVEEAFKTTEKLLQKAERTIDKEQYALVSSGFDIISWIKGRIEYVKNSDSGRGIRGC